MLDFHSLAGQLGGFTEYRREEDARRAARLERSVIAIEKHAPEWEAVAERVRKADERGAPLRALPLERLDARTAAPARPAEVTVVAADGSQIFPDRDVEPACYLLNVSRVAFHYGTTDAPVLAAEPTLRYHVADLAELAAPDEAPFMDVTSEVVSALRDQLELESLFATAAQERRAGRPIVALADGTLIRWMLRGMKNRALEDRLIARYLEVLELFREAELPVASYVSRPGTDEVVNTLLLASGESGPDVSEPRGLLDRHLFERHLAVGQRSAMFLSGSRILREYGPDHHVAFFYVRQRGEVARVEMPHWVARRREWVDLVHAVVLDDAEKGGGYPVVLAEAHERAVIRGADREIFYHLLERQLGAGGLTRSAKAAAKRTPRI